VNINRKLNPDTARLRLADTLAEYCLEGIVDKQGKPFIDHCRRVAARCQEKGMQEYQLVAALLHDCVEDSFLYLDSIGNIFGFEVQQIVDLLTREDGESYKQYIEHISRHIPSLLVKMADLEDNLDKSRGPIPSSLRKRYLEAHETLIRAIKEYQNMYGILRDVSR
jgi:(p)ppGpp synthase/HD superfamily hydrolase